MCKTSEHCFHSLESIARLLAIATDPNARSVQGSFDIRSVTPTHHARSTSPSLFGMNSVMKQTSRTNAITTIGNSIVIKAAGIGSSDGQEQRARVVSSPP